MRLHGADRGALRWVAFAAALLLGLAPGISRLAMPFGGDAALCIGGKLEWTADATRHADDGDHAGHGGMGPGEACGYCALAAQLLPALAVPALPHVAADLPALPPSRYHFAGAPPSRRAHPPQGPPLSAV